MKENRRRGSASFDDPLPSGPFSEAWLRLTPAQRLRRSWRLRRFLNDPEAAHDAKSLPQL